MSGGEEEEEEDGDDEVCEIETSDRKFMNGSNNETKLTHWEHPR